MLCDVLDDGPEKTKLKKIFEIFSAPRDLLFAKRFLNEDEISYACKKCEEFCEEYPLLFPGKTIKPKMHFYSFDVPRFLKKHKTLGLLSEEEGESSHSAINMENRVLACVRDPGTNAFGLETAFFKKSRISLGLIPSSVIKIIPS